MMCGGHSMHQIRHSDETQGDVRASPAGAHRIVGVPFQTRSLGDGTATSFWFGGVNIGTENTWSIPTLHVILCFYLFPMVLHDNFVNMHTQQKPTQFDLV